jgi:putative oxidoreductase
MRVASVVARLLLGFVFLIFGLNGFLHFLPMPAPTGVLGQFFGALSASSYLTVIFLFQVIPAAFLLIDRYVPLALAVLAPVIVNIVCIHIFMDPSGIPLAVLVAALWVVVYFDNRSAFAGLFQQRGQVQARVRRQEFQGGAR